MITVLPYQYPRMRGGDALEKLEAAARSGGATLFGTGINPGFMFERIVLAATGLSDAVERVSLSEYVNVEHITGGAEFLSVMGFGMETADPDAVNAVAGTVANYLTQYLHYAAEAMGLTIERLEREDEHLPAPADLEIPGVFTLKAGTVALVRFRWTAHCEEGPTLSTQVNWYATDAMRPHEAQGQGDDFWKVEIEGRPSVRFSGELCGTLGGERVHPQNPIHPSMLATAVTAVQAIGKVIDAEPGVTVVDPPQVHWKRDQRVALRRPDYATTSEGR